jgi:type II secretion system protein H
VRNQRAFTLIELLAVTVLMAVAASMVALRLDGFTVHGRLRAALSQIAAVHRLARMEAITSGQPRRISYAVAEDRCAIERPEVAGGEWGWVAGSAQQISGRVRIDGVVVASNGASQQSVDGIRIRSDGTSTSYVVVISAADSRAAVSIHGLTGRGRPYYDLPQQLADQPLDLLEAER